MAGCCVEADGVLVFYPLGMTKDGDECLFPPFTLHDGR